MSAPCARVPSVGSNGERRIRKRPRRARFELHKAMFVLPNLFTVSSIFCGFYAITLCLGAPEPLDLRRAALSIFFAMFFDMFDGRVARLTKTQSEFGVQLDSLADLLSFGSAPAVLLYRWTLSELGFFGLVIAFLYVACGALRLARFNVLAAREPGSSKYFVGLPIPLAAGTIVALVLASYPFDRTTVFGGAVGVGIITIALAGLMVSGIRYRTFKHLRVSKKSISLGFLTGLVLAAVASRLKAEVALALLFLGYISLGLVEEVVFFRARSAERRLARARFRPTSVLVPPASTLEAEGPGDASDPKSPSPAGPSTSGGSSGNNPASPPHAGAH
ncbi:MAG: CDP-diacylglycerol--serine O-phosphatidyltransferase [Deltaproteobacteria bacterium]|nr:CDP-diacylglycerol--serine O-phosphatidyltransferase [Deltaproteobacteria bacterium]